MLDHLKAIINVLTAQGLDVYLQDAVKYDDVGYPTELEYPYLIVWTTSYRPTDEKALDDVADDITATIGITAVATTPQGAAIVAENAKQLLGATKYRRLDVPGRLAYIRWSAFQTAQVDRDVKLPDTNRHPAFQVDIYRLESTPT